MHAHDQHLFVVRAVEDADAAALGQVACGAPKEVVLQLLSAGVLKAEHLTALRVDAGHDVADGAILARRVHRLEDHQQGVAVRRVQKALLLAQLFHMLLQPLAGGLLGFAQRLDLRGPAVEVDLIAFPHLECLGVDVHTVSRLSP
ncbi:hypothetical protein D3C78_1550210 [compost metagenome]